MSERDKIAQEIIDLKAHLNASDYKITKAWEAEKLGKEEPYDMAAVIEERDATRKRINELEDQLAAMPEEDKAAQ